jgi:hypothetical protein
MNAGVHDTARISLDQTSARNFNNTALILGHISLVHVAVIVRIKRVARGKTPKLQKCDYFPATIQKDESQFALRHVALNIVQGRQASRNVSCISLRMNPASKMASTALAFHEPGIYSAGRMYGSPNEVELK